MKIHQLKRYFAKITLVNLILMTFMNIHYDSIFNHQLKRIWKVFFFFFNNPVQNQFSPRIGWTEPIKKQTNFDQFLESRTDPVSKKGSRSGLVLSTSPKYSPLHEMLFIFVIYSQLDHERLRCIYSSWSYNMKKTILHWFMSLRHKRRRTWVEHNTLTSSKGWNINFKIN